MIDYLMIAAVAWFAGWLYGRMQSQRIEKSLEADLEAMEDRCWALKRRLAAKEGS